MGVLGVRRVESLWLVAHSVNCSKLSWICCGLLHQRVGSHAAGYAFDFGSIGNNGSKWNRHCPSSNEMGRFRIDFVWSGIHQCVDHSTACITW